MSERNRMGCDVETVSHVYPCGKFVMIVGNRYKLHQRAHHKVCEVCKKIPIVKKDLVVGNEKKSTITITGMKPSMSTEYHSMMVDEHIRRSKNRVMSN